MTPDESRDQLVDVVGQTSALFEGDFTALHDPVVGPCEWQSGSDGVSWGYGETGPGDPNPNTAVERVATLWESLGISVRIPSDAPLPIIYGTGGPVDTISFTADTELDRYSVSGGSICVQGDFSEIVHE